MPQIACQFTGCEYTAENDSVEIAIALLNSHNSIHLQMPSRGPDLLKTPKVDRPELNQDISDEDWESFAEEWNRFKRSWYRADMTQRTVVDQLVECCQQDLRRLLIKEDPAILNDTEDNVLAAMRKMAVIPIAASVRRTKLLTSRQDHGQTFREFYANTRAAAATCAYKVKCHHACCTDNAPIDYTQEVVKDILLAGIIDVEIRKDVLSLTDLDSKSARDIVRIVEEKETARNACLDSTTTSVTAASTSTYRKRNRNSGKNDAKVSEQQKLNIMGECEKCGNQFPQFIKLAHGRINREPFLMCSSCFKLSKGGQHHNGKSTAQTSSLDSFIGGISLVLGLSNDKTQSVVSLDHHIFTPNGWQQATKFKHPKLQLLAYVNDEDYTALGLCCPNINPLVLEVFPDSGAQSCLWSLKGFLSCGFSMADLVPVSHKITAANSAPIQIKGAIILRLVGTSPNGSEQEAAVIVYISPDSSEFFLSKEAMIQLGVIAPTFPQVGKAIAQHKADSVASIKSAGNWKDKKASCGCFVHTKPPGLPDKLPFPCIPENNKLMKEWLLKRYASSTFNQCRHQPLPCMKGPPIRLHVSPDAVPVNVGGKFPPVPIHWQGQVKDGLDEDSNLEVLEEVPYGVPTKWLHRMVLRRKKNGEIRRTIDLSPLNKYCEREVHPSKTPFNLAHSVPGDTYKTVFDAWNGYHSVPIHEDDRHYTNFITPFGIYRYCRAPQGFLSSGDGYDRRFQELLAEIERLLRIRDDCLLYDVSLEDHWWHVMEFLEVVGHGGVVINKDKFQFAEGTVDFAGFRITSSSVEPVPKYLESIRSYPTPQDITEIRSWFGLVNQVAHYSQLREMMEPFRKFLSPKVKFEWNEELDTIFQESKFRIVEAIKEGVRIFDPTKRTALCTDWCKTGIGYWLVQKQCECLATSPGCCPDGWHIVLAGSRHSKPEERNYAPIEGEALAVAWSLEDTHFFTMGCDNLVVITDHKPLVKIFTDRRLDEINNTRLQKFKQRTMRWYFEVEYQPGKSHYFADATCHHPNGFEDPESPPTMTDVLEDDIIAAVMVDVNKFCAVTIDMVQSATKTDASLSFLISLVLSGFPSNQTSIPASCKMYWPFRGELSVHDGVLLYKDRVVIPPSLRPRVLNNLHSAHQGVSSMTARAQVAIFWPGISGDIQRTRDECRECNKNAPSQVRSPPFMPRIPKTPFEMIVADYFTLHGKHYLIIGDRLSGWTEVLQIKSGGLSSGARGLCNALRKIFSTFGVPIEITSDGGPEFSAGETEVLMKTWGVHHVLSSAYFPQGNGRAELAVKATKRLLEGNTDTFGNLDTNKVVCALLQQRNTPDRDCKLSPAQVLYGHPLRDSMPQLSAASIFENGEIYNRWHEAWSAKEDAMRSRLVHTCEELEPRSKVLTPLRVGDLVFIQNQNPAYGAPRKWDRQGIVVTCKDYDQYVVKVIGSQRLTLRNRRFLRKFKERPAQVQDTHISCTPTAPGGSVKPAHPDENDSSSFTDATCQDANDGFAVEDDEDNQEDNSADVGRASHRPPLMLKNLMSYNKPGAKETPADVFDHAQEVCIPEDQTLTVNPRRSSRVKKGVGVYDASTGLSKTLASK